MTGSESPTDGRRPDRLDDLWADLEEKLQEERGFRARLRSLPTRLRYLLVAVVLLGIAGAVAATRLRPDLDACPVLRFDATVAWLFVLAVLGAAAILRPLHRRRVGRLYILLLTLVALATPLALALAPAVHHDPALHPESFADRGPHFLGAAASCLAFGFLTGLPLIAALILLDRKDDRRGLRALLLAAVAGLAGNLALQIHCPLVSPAHLLAGHATVPLAFVVAVTVMTRRRGRRRGRNRERPASGEGAG